MNRDKFRKMLQEREDLRRPADSDSREHILVIDDDKGVRDALEQELGKHYRVTLANSAAHGIFAMTTRPSVVVLDIKMGEHDGFYAFREIRKIDGAVPIIFHSAYHDVKDPYEIMNDYKPFGFITKGSSLAVLRKQIELAVDYYRKHVVQRAELDSKLQKMSAEVDRLRALLKK